MNEFNQYLTTTGISFVVSSVVVLLNNFILYRCRNRCTKYHPIANKDEPIANKDNPIANKYDPIANKDNPIANKYDPIANKYNPIANKYDPIANKDDQIADENQDLDSIKNILLDQLDRKKVQLDKENKDIDIFMSYHKDTEDMNELTKIKQLIDTKLGQVKEESDYLQSLKFPNLNCTQIIEFLSDQLDKEAPFLNEYKPLNIYEFLKKIIQINEIKLIKENINKIKNDEETEDDKKLNEKYLVLEIIHRRLEKEKLEIEKEIEELDNGSTLFSQYLNKVNENIRTISDIQLKIRYEEQLYDSGVSVDLQNRSHSVPVYQFIMTAGKDKKI
jgi:hypothetical protein